MTAKGFLGLLLACPLACAAADPAEEVGSPPESGTAAARIDEILTRLQRRSDGLSDIRCKVQYVEDDRINLSKRRRQGEILFQITQPNPHFLIHFDHTETDGVLGKQEWYLFDGRWLYQALERIRQVTKQEMVRANEKIDLFDLESAPFPLPFGQKKATILRNFDVTLLPPAPGDPPETDHLVCIPKPGSTVQRRYDKLEFFIRRDIDLPARIVVTRNDGYEVNTADFLDLSNRSINAGLKKKAFARPKAWKGYEEIVERLPPVEKQP